MRPTRSQLREATNIHADETATLEASTAHQPPVLDDERAPLGETTGNTAEKAPLEEDMPPAKASKSTRGRQGKGGKRGKKAEDGIEDEQEQRETPGNEEMAAEGQASEEERAEGNMHVQEDNERPASPAPRAARMTRRQLANEEEVLSKFPNEMPPEVRVQDADEVERGRRDQQKVLVVDVRSQENTSATEDEARTPRPSAQSSASTSPGTSRTRMATSIEEIDALEEALENISNSIPNLRRSCTGNARLVANDDPFSGSDSDSSVPVKTSVQKRSKGPQSVKLVKENAQSKPTNPVSKKPVAPTAARPGASTTKPTATATRPAASPMKPGLSRSSSVKASSVSSRDSSVKPRGTGDVADYLASKRRPISMSFPVPPPPPKSTKPPTRPTFQLPGEAVAARLKAQREERLKREEEEAKTKREFKARPIPKATAPVTVRETKSSKVRESLMHGTPATATDGHGSVDAAKTAKRASVVNATTKFRVPAMLTREPANKPATAPVVKSTVTLADIAVQREKGKQIFNRDKIEKEERERMRREKEEAAKRARAEAAERGRQASREWAEKQKKKALAMAAAKSN